MTQFSEPDVIIATALALGSTHDAAAKAAGVSRSTVARRSDDPAFRELISTIRRASVERAVGMLADALADAVAQLRLITTDGDSEGNRLKASIAVLELGKKYLTDADLEERVRRLEEANAGPSTPSP